MAPRGNSFNYTTNRNEIAVYYPSDLYNRVENIIFFKCTNSTHSESFKKAEMYKCSKFQIFIAFFSLQKPILGNLIVTHYATLPSSHDDIEED